MGSIGSNRESGAVVSTRNYPGVNETVSNRINTILDDKYAMQTEQTVFIGERVPTPRGGRAQDTLLTAEQKKALIADVKAELKKRGLTKKVSITTPRMGPNIFSQYLHIR